MTVSNSTFMDKYATFIIALNSGLIVKLLDDCYYKLQMVSEYDPLSETYVTCCEIVMSCPEDNYETFDTMEWDANDFMAYVNENMNTQILVDLRYIIRYQFNQTVCGSGIISSN